MGVYSGRLVLICAAPTLDRAGEFAGIFARLATDMASVFTWRGHESALRGRAQLRLGTRSQRTEVTSTTRRALTRWRLAPALFLRAGAV